MRAVIFQDLAKKPSLNASNDQKCALHSAVSVMLRIISDLTAITTFRQHFNQVAIAYQTNHDSIYQKIQNLLKKSIYIILSCLSVSKKSVYPPVTQQLSVV